MVDYTRGALIVFEGLDRSGKTTQSAKLLEHFTHKGQKAKIQRFPDRDEQRTGPLIDQFLKTATNVNDSREVIHLLFSANPDQIRNEIENGVTLIVDRYSFSGVTYSMAKGLDKNWVCQPEVGLPRPDLVLFFDIDPEKTSSRSGFGEEVMERGDFQKLVYQNVLGIYNEKYWKKINAADTIENVHNSVVSEVELLLTNLAANKTLENMDLSDFGL
uniref:dTMP kinase n=1 Tax=Ditylenchus dipsaci TaxID=166011 RepID=A0A915DEJ9_9BILA